MGLIEIFFVLVVIGVALYLIGLIPMDKTILLIIRAVVILMVVWWVLSVFGLVSGHKIKL